MSTEMNELSPDELAHTAIDEALPDPEVQINESDEQPKGVAQALRREQRVDNAAQRKADREAGRQSILDAYNKRAQAAGFKTVEEMFAAQQRADGKGDGKTVQSEALRQAQAQIETLNRQIRGYKSRISALETELQLRNIAYESDVNPDDIEYVVSRVHTAFKNLDDDAAKKFDPKKFIGEDLKAKKPSVFRQAIAAQQAATETKAVEEQPINTAPAGSTPRPAGTTETKLGSTEPPRRATEMTRQEYAEALRKRGIRNPAGYV